MKSASVDRSSFVRIFDSARTAHFERLPGMTPATFIFRRRNYDFVPPRSSATEIRQLSRSRTLLFLLRAPVCRVELNEPAALNTWPSTFIYIAVLRVRRRFLGQRIQPVYYAIENADPCQQIAGRLRLPMSAARLVARVGYAFLLPRGSRVAFGTLQARHQYSQTWPSLEARCEVRIFPAAAPACSTCPPTAKGDAVVFLGAFEARKGILLLLEAWDRVRSEHPNAKLRVLGKGELVGEVSAWAASRPEVDLHIDPSREVIHDSLSDAKCLALVSLRDKYWREQIGLPILEGLSHGCEIVASNETGIAAWLTEHGHTVVDVDSEESLTDRVTAGLVRGLSSSRTVAEIVRALPNQDGRLDADHWLFHD